jgi:hypothetical protein
MPPLWASPTFARFSARRGNFGHPVKLLNLVEDMSGGFQSVAEKPREA